MNNSESLPVSPDRSSGGLTRVALWVGACLAAYVLSTGPAVKLLDSNIISWEPLATFYAPLQWAADNCKPVEHFFEWYLTDIWHWNPYIMK